MAEEAANWGFPSLRSYQRFWRVAESPLAPFVFTPGFTFGAADKLLSSPVRLKWFLEEAERLRATLPPAEEGDWPKEKSESVSLPTHGTETRIDVLAMLGTLLGWISKGIRSVAAKNDPDVQRGELGTIATNIDVLGETLSSPNLAAELCCLLKQAGLWETAGQTADRSDGISA
jgi:hypothetical protein